MIQELIASTGFSIIIVTLLFTPLAALVLTTLAGKKRSIETITAVSTFLILIQGIILVAAVISEKTVTAFNGLFYVDALGAVVEEGNEVSEWEGAVAIEHPAERVVL